MEAPPLPHEPAAHGLQAPIDQSGAPTYAHASSAQPTDYYSAPPQQHHAYSNLPPPPMPEAQHAAGTGSHPGYNLSNPSSSGHGQYTINDTVANNSGQIEESAEAREVRKRRQRWGPPANAPQDAAAASTEGPPKKKRKSRWESEEVTTVGAYLPTFPKEITLPGGIRVVLPPAVTGEPAYTDPKLNQLHERLNEYNRKLASNELDIPPEGQRSPSPEPIYDKNGIRLNTREIRYREKLVDKRNRVVEELIKEDPNYKPPPDYKPRKYQRKIFIPIQEHPGYNFIGLIIGPRGNTQKRMQSETNTKIAIRGRGSVKEGASRDPKYDYGEDEELHVLITGDKQEDVDKAYDMIERLLRVDDDELNEHKRLQLRELAALNGTLKDEQPCYHCGEVGHRPMDCPKGKQELYVLPEAMQQQVQQQYQRDIARVHGSAPREDEEYKAFMRELGGAPPPELMGMMDDGGKRGEPLPDECKLYVANLSLAFNEAMLKQMFEPFGAVLHATIMKDGATGGSRGFGFVHLADPASARIACEGMNNRVIDGKPLIVRLRSEGPKRGERAPPVYEFDESKLYVCYLPTNVSEPQLQALFGRYGPVTEVKLIIDKVTGMSRGYCFITMGSPGAAQAAIRGLTGYKLDGKAIGVRVAGTGRVERDPRPGGGPHMMYPTTAPLPGYGPPPPGYQAAPYGVPPPHAAVPPYPYAPAAAGYGAPAEYGYYPPPTHPPSPPPPGTAPAAAPGTAAADPSQAYHYPPPGTAPAPSPYGAAAPAYPPASYYPPAAAGAPPAYPGYPPPAEYYPGYPPAAAAAAPTDYPAPPDYTEYPEPPGAAPLPSSEPPPLPAGPPPDKQVQNEYEKFMSEMQSTFR